jgi:mannose-6-phosphate isomerase
VGLAGQFGISSKTAGSAREMARIGLFRKAAASPKPSTAGSVFAALSPFRIEPHFDPRVWGSRDLRPWFDCIVEDRQESHATDSGYISKEPIGEVWLTGDMCPVATGPHTGKTLARLFEEEPEPLLGKGVPLPASPLLIKVIFAREKLSVQVHPDDRLAQKYGQPRGKTECWYVLAAEPGAKVAAGLKPGVTLDQVRSGIHDGTLESSLQLLSTEPGEMIFVDAGTVHSIWPGAVLLETQQNCDLTYRMYDYGRPRELHIEKSLEATRLVTRAGKVLPRVLADRTILIDESYFCVERIPFTASRTSTTLPGVDEPTPRRVQAASPAQASALSICLRVGSSPCPHRHPSSPSSILAVSTSSAFRRAGRKTPRIRNSSLWPRRPHRLFVQHHPRSAELVAKLAEPRCEECFPHGHKHLAPIG